MINEIELINKAIDACKYSYSPYSNFKVGAALVTKDGRYFQGTNIENASYGLSNCAERSLLFSSYSQGVKKEDIIGFAIYSPSESLVSPCGACRQVISELVNLDVPVYMAYGSKGKFEKVLVKDLLPYCFSKDNLNV